MKNDPYPLPKPESRLYPLLRDANEAFKAEYSLSVVSFTESYLSSDQDERRRKNQLAAAICLRIDQINRLACLKIRPPNEIDEKRNILAAQLCALEEIAFEKFGTKNPHYFYDKQRNNKANGYTGKRPA